jgi:hypothetical protein
MQESDSLRQSSLCTRPPYQPACAVILLQRRFWGHAPRTTQGSTVYTPFNGAPTYQRDSKRRNRLRCEHHNCVFAAEQPPNVVTRQQQYASADAHHHCAKQHSNLRGAAAAGAAAAV